MIECWPGPRKNLDLIPLEVFFAVFFLGGGDDLAFELNIVNFGFSNNHVDRPLMFIN